MKRSWQSAQILMQDEGYTVALDGRPVKLPSGAPLTVPFKTLAEAIAEEWAGAPPEFSLEDLPLTPLASTAQTLIATHRADIIGQLAAYGMNDLICYRAEMPADLAARQRKSWDRWLIWAEETYGISLNSTSGVVPMNQPPGAKDMFRKILTAQSDHIIAALGVIVPALGSLILGLALAAMALDPRSACQVSFLDEVWQEERWGTDNEAEKRRTKIVDEVTISARFMQLCRT